MEMVNFTCDQCERKYIYRCCLHRHVTRNHTDHPVFVDVACIDMLQGIILIILSLTVVNERDHLLDLLIWRSKSEPVLMVKLLLLLQLLRNDMLVLLQSSSCNRTVHCEYERGRSFINIEESYSAFHTCNDNVPASYRLQLLSLSAKQLIQLLLHAHQ